MIRFSLIFLSLLLMTRLLGAIPSPEAGKINLTNWNIKENKIISLAGEWLFEKEGVQSPLRVPGSWNPKSKATPLGMGVYRLTLVLPPDPSPLKIHFRAIHGAHRFFVNDTFVGEGGYAGAEQLRSYLYPLPHGELVQLRLEIENRAHDQGGLVKTVELGQAEAMNRQALRRFAWNLLIFIVLLVMAMYHLGFYWLQQEMKHHLYFALLCLFAAPMQLIVSDGYWLGLFPQLSWGFVERVSSLIELTLVWVLLRLGQTLAQGRQEGKIYKLFFASIFVLAAAALFWPLVYYNVLMYLIDAWLWAALLGMTFLFLKGYRSRQSGVLLYLIEGSICLLTLANDIAYDFGYSPLGLFTPLAVIIIVFIETFFVARRFNVRNLVMEDLSSRVLWEQAQGRIRRLYEGVVGQGSKGVQGPLRSLLHLAQKLLAEVGKLSPEVRLDVEAVYFQSLRLGATLGDILDFVQNEELEIHSESLDLFFQVETVIRMLNTWAQDQGVELRNQCPHNLIVWADPLRLQQVLLNLLDNAIRYGQGPIRVAVEAGDEECEILICDAGPGLPQVWQDWLRGVIVLQPESQGRTLGLWICKRLLEAQGTQLRLKAGDLEQTCLGFGLTRAQAPVETPLVEVGEDLPDPPSLPMEATILVVDDEPANIMLMTQFLAQAQLRVISASNAMHALELVDEQVPDLVILDLLMPWMSGFELCAKLREYYDPVQLPIIVVTGVQDMSSLIKLLDVGANDYIAKPFQQAELLARVKGQLRLKELGQYKEELSRRKLMEKDLQQAWSRLGLLMEHSLNGLFFLNQEGCFSYVNVVAAAVLEQDVKRMKGLCFEDVFNEPWQEQNWQVNPEQVLSLKGNGKEVHCSFVLLEDSSGVHFAGLVSESLLLRSGQIIKMKTVSRQEGVEKLEVVCKDVLRLAQKEGSTILSCVQRLEASLLELNSDLATQEFRKSLVELMQLALDTWMKKTKKGKLELAEESGIWRATLDNGVYRTRTLDKYLTLDALPVKPRWKDVVQTAEFVLEQLRKKKVVSRNLERAIEEIKKIAASLEERRIFTS